PSYFGGITYDYFKVFIILLFDYVLFISFLEYVFRNSFYTTSFLNLRKLVHLIFSNLFVVLLITIVCFVFFRDIKFLSFVVAFDFLILLFEEFKRFIFSRENINNGGRDFVLNNFIFIYGKLKKELEGSDSVVQELKNQINIQLSSKKVLVSKFSHLKERSINFLNTLESQEKKYEELYNFISNILGDFSTYVLSIEYSLNKSFDLIYSMSSFFNSSYNEVYSSSSKKAEIEDLILKNQNILNSLISKLDTVNEIISQILLFDNKIKDDVRLISEEIVSLNVISTNAEIEAFKLRSSSSIIGIVEEISKISNSIRTYDNDIKSQYKGLKDSFEYIASVSGSIIKHTEGINRNFESVKFILGEVINSFSSYLGKIITLESDFSNAMEILGSIRSDVSKLREILNSISDLLSLVDSIRYLLSELKQFLENLVVVIEELEANVLQG
ncbi:MAG: hypothetical protein ACP5KI_06880, partial [Brevinematia bacterium]